MPRIIKDRDIVQDDWQTLTGEVSSQVLAQHAGQNVIVPLQCWLQQKDILANHKGRIAVWLDSHELPEQLASELDTLPLVGLNFPEFKDGRTFSSARELRERFAYKGEIRAIGDVTRDQLFYMARCGFDAFAMREDQDLERSLESFDDFRDAYQPAIDQPLPLFRRR
jgi:uncharacterized protein (DUF934 family)